MFSPDVQRGTTGGEDGQPFTGREQFRDEGGGGRDLLEVIEHQQQTLAGQMRDKRGTEGLRPAFRASEHLSDSGEDERGVADRGEGHKEDAVWERWQGSRRGIEHEAGLPDAPDPRDRDEPHRRIAQKRGDGRQIAFPANEWGQRFRNSARRVATSRLAQRRRPHPRSDLETLPLVVAQIERAHEQAQRLALGPAPHAAFEVADRAGADG